jgi:hypothetical protein
MKFHRRRQYNHYKMIRILKAIQLLIQMKTMSSNLYFSQICKNSFFKIYINAVIDDNENYLLTTCQDNEVKSYVENLAA